MNELVVDAVIDNVPVVTDFVEQQLTEAGCPMKVIMKMNIAIDEVFSNIAYYAYEGGKGEAKIQVDCEDNSLKLIFSDSGKPYNPLEKDDPDITLAAEDREVGGLGIFMVKNMMDDIAYEYKDGQNILTMTKGW